MTTKSDLLPWRVRLKRALHSPKPHPRLFIAILEPSEAFFSVSDFSRPVASYDSPNPGVSRIEVHCQIAPGGAETLRLVAIPGSIPGEIEIPSRTSLEDWANDGRAS